jgi:hypothetical protein
MRRVYWFFRLLIESILNGIVNRSVTLSLSVVMFLLLGLVIIGAKISAPFIYTLF